MASTDWRPSQHQQRFIREYSKAIESWDAALFAGAGLSRPAGFVDWKGLLKEITEDLGLDIDKESDLIAVAQYHLNTRQNRARLNQALIDEFTKQTAKTRNHYVIARLPLHTIWTTNYDQLIEEAFKEAGKVIDVKITQENLAQSRRGRDVDLYKMHGCVTQPQDAVLTKDDYESYERRRPLFVESLKGHLISKTFLFIGFSFLDPNVDYVLSRIRVLLDTNQREHFCIMRAPSRPRRLKGRVAADYEYEMRKFKLRTEDLKRFAIETIEVSEYSEIEYLLETISFFTHRKNVFISGSAAEFKDFGKEKMDDFSRAIGQKLITEGYNLISGFGYGIGEQCVIGALRALHQTQKGADKDRTLILPFPRTTTGISQESMNTRHREDLISRSGLVIFLAGNRADPGGKIELSSGVREEFEIAKRMHRFVIPVAATGYVAKEIWAEVISDVNKFFPNIAAREYLEQLAKPTATINKIVDAIFGLLKLIIQAREA
jgi:Sir2- and TIR-associating SLOG family/SIR2-like domain